MERISNLPPERWPELIATLNGLAAERHLQTFFNNEAAQNEIDRVGWSGALNPAGMLDHLMEVESNYWGTKSNYFLARHFTLVLTHRDGNLHHKLVVDMVNDDPHGLDGRFTYKADVRLYVGSSASVTSNNLRSVRYSNPVPPNGTGLIDGWLFVDCCGSRGQAVIEYDTPWQADPKGLHRVYWQKQPGTTADPVDLMWTTENQSFRASGDLGQDRVITLTPNGISFSVGHAAQVTLPSLSLG
jgi:hypothetical protein